MYLCFGRGVRGVFFPTYGDVGVSILVFGAKHEGLHPEIGWNMASGNRCLVQGCHDGVGRLVIDMVNPTRLAVSAFFWLKWMASFIFIGITSKCLEWGIFCPNWCWWWRRRRLALLIMRAMITLVINKCKKKYKSNLCQGSTSFFMVLSLLPWNVSEMWSFNLYNFALKESRPGNSNTNKGNKKNRHNHWSSFDFYCLGCQVMKTTCREVDGFSIHLKRINTRIMRIYPNERSEPKTRMFETTTKNIGNKDFISVDNYKTCIYIYININTNELAK